MAAQRACQRDVEGVIEGQIAVMGPGGRRQCTDHLVPKVHEGGAGVQKFSRIIGTEAAAQNSTAQDVADLGIDQVRSVAARGRQPLAQGGRARAPAEQSERESGGVDDDIHVSDVQL